MHTSRRKSNILVNKPNETKYFYQDLDSTGARHFFEPNPIKRYSVGTKNKDLKTAADGSLTIYLQASEPADAIQRANWLPSPKGEDFSLYVCTYWPGEAITSGTWTPPAVVKVP